MLSYVLEYFLFLLLKMRYRYCFPGPLKQDSSRISEADSLKDEDEEFSHIMSRLDELEEEELAAEIENGRDSDENKENNAAESDNEDNEDGQADTVFDQFSDKISLDQDLRHSEVLLMYCF